MSGPISPEALAAMLGRWAGGRGPLYLLLAGRLRALIDEGALPGNAPLPAERRLARALSVGRGTVVAAYQALREEGRLVARQGSGTRIAPRDLPVSGPAAQPPHNPQFQGMVQANYGPDTIVLTCAAPEDPPPEVIAAYRHAADRLGDLRSDIGYHPTGVFELRAAIADRYTRRGLDTDPEQVLVTTGAQQALDLTVRAFVNPGDAVLTEDPTFPGALAQLGAAAAVIRTVPVGTDGIDVRELEQRFDAHRPVLTYLIPSFQNPTGTVLGAMQRRRIALLASDHQGVVIDDETMAELGFDGPPPAPIAAYGDGGTIVSIGSLSKLCWGGLRVGWARAARPVISRLARLKALSDLGGEMLSQYAAARILRDPSALAERRRAQLRANHDRLTEDLAAALPEWSWTPARGGQTLWVRLPYGDAVSFAQLALRHGVAVLPGDALSPGRGEQWLRLPFIVREGTISAAVGRLAAAWRAYDNAHADPDIHSSMVV